MEKVTLERLLDRAFIKLNEAVNRKEGRLHIPDRTDSNRVSEQELKYLFIQEFLNCEKCNNYSFSIETPTENENYRFSNKDKKKIKPLKYPPEDRTGRCGNIDVVIFKGSNRVAIIEFKANNSGWFEHGKDFLKLANEPNQGHSLLRCFVEVYSKTDNNLIENNVAKKVYDNEYYPKASNTIFIGYSLYHKESGGYNKFSSDDNARKIIETSFLECEI
ncbi:MAG: hypothetical protein K6E93_05795 [Bacteroidales bacterium]|nr:hypothetical protein [Bacteroidales bacterium]